MSAAKAFAWERRSRWLSAGTGWRDTQPQYPWLASLRHDCRIRIQRQKVRQGNGLGVAATPLEIPKQNCFYFAVFAKMVLIISLPTLIASGNRGSKYVWICSNFSRYASMCPKLTRSLQSCCSSVNFTA